MRALGPNVVRTFCVLSLTGCSPFWGAGMVFRACSSLARSSSPPGTTTATPPTPSPVVPAPTAAPAQDEEGNGFGEDVPDQGTAPLALPSYLEPIESSKEGEVPRLFGGAVDLSKDEWFVPHAAIYAIRLPRHVLVHATSGVWLHDATSFERLGRIAPTGAAAIAVDDKRTVFGMSVEAGSQCLVTVYDARSFRAIRSTRADCPNGRMRFSEDGESLAIPSMGGNSTTVFSWRAKTSVRIANSTDVNDAIPFAKGTLVATVDDANLAYVVDVRTRKAIVSSSIARDPPKHDLNAVYVSSTRNEIYFGGEDNLVWIFGFKHRDESATFDFFSVRRLGPLYGGIEDILSVSNDRTLVATDSGNIYLFDADWHELAKTGYGGALSTRTESMRLSPNGRSVLVTHNGQLFVWSGDPLPPKHAGHAFGEPQSVYGMGTRTADHGLTDAVFTAGLEGRVLWRVRKPAKNTANVYPEKIAEYTHPPRILPLSGGTRLVRVTESGFCRFEQLVQGKLTPIETHFTGKCPVGINHPHRTKAGVVDNTGALSTIDQTGRVRKVGTFGLPYEGMTDRANLRYLNGAWEFQDGGVTERIRDR